MTSPDVLKTFDASGSLVAYQDAPAFSDFVATDSARLIAAVRKIGRSKRFQRSFHIFLLGQNLSASH